MVDEYPPQGNKKSIKANTRFTPQDPPPPPPKPIVKPIKVKPKIVEKPLTIKQKIVSFLKRLVKRK